jgi:hypothetical protein
VWRVSNACSPRLGLWPTCPVRSRRRSVAMLPVGVPALDRDEALEVLGQLVDALSRLRALERSERDGPPAQENPQKLGAEPRGCPSFLLSGA